MTEDPALPITALILSRSKVLGLTRNDLVRLAGYTDTSKGRRRLDELCAGDFRSGQRLLKGLPSALQVSPEVVKQAVEATHHQFHEEKEAAYRASFVPHAIILTERKIPHPIHIAAIVGVERLLRVDFDLTKGPATFAEQARHGLREKLRRWKGDIPTFGKATGLVVNYSPDHAVEFELTGNPVRVLEQAHRAGIASFSLKGRASPLTRGELAAVFGSGE